jgi:hypothetical protein
MPRLHAGQATARLDLPHQGYRLLVLAIVGGGAAMQGPQVFGRPTSTWKAVQALAEERPRPAAPWPASSRTTSREPDAAISFRRAAAALGEAFTYRARETRGRVTENNTAASKVTPANPTRGR